MSNDNNHYTNYFNKNKIINDIINTPLESGRDNNFNYIGENLSERIYLQIKEKRKKVSEFYNSFDEKYDTKGIIVNVWFLYIDLIDFIFVIFLFSLYLIKNDINNLQILNQYDSFYSIIYIIIILL